MTSKPPELPPVDDPVENLIDPLSPEEPEFGVEREIPPDVDASDLPDDSAM